MANSSAKRKPADKTSAKGATLGAKGRKTTGSAAKKAAAALKAAAKPAPKTRKKPGPKLGSKRGALTASGKPRQKPGPKKGTKRGALTAAGKPRKKPGPKPKTAAPTKAAAKKTAKPKTLAKKAAVKKITAKKAPAKKSVAKKAALKKTTLKKTKPKTSPAPKTSAAAKPVARKSVQKSVKAPVKKAASKTPAKISAVKTIAAAKIAVAQAKGANKPAAKKIMAKKAVTKKAVIKKAVVKKTPAKPATQRTAVATPTAPSKPSTAQIETLRSRINAVALRMKKADADTAKRVNLLEKAFRTLEAKMDGQSPVGLADQVALLSKKLSQVAQSANADVTATLAGALDKPSADTLTRALAQAEHRLNTSEAAQSASIARISQHIADMALAIDARFRKESDTRDAALSEIRRETLDRVETVEFESAQAIKGLGEKVIAIADKLGQRPTNNDAVITEKVSEIALKTQEEFEQYRSKLERRLETLEAEQRQTLAATDQAILGLSSRLDGVEYVASTATPVTNADPASKPDVPAPSEAGDVLTNLLTTEKRVHTPPSVVEDDPFAPDADAGTANVPPNPYAIPEPEPEIAQKPDHIPTEFNPQEFAPNAYAGETQIPPPSSIAATPSSSLAVSALNPTRGPELATSPIPAPIPEPVHAEPSLPGSDSYTAPYADPAYAEAHSGYDTAMDQARPGNFGTEKPRFTMPNISTQHMKIAGMVAIAGTVGLIGLKVFSGGDSAPTSAPPYIVADNSQSGIGTNIGGIQTASTPALQAPAVLETAPTIGTYEDNTVDVAPAGSPEAVTLEAAADAGNPIAQYQLGVSFLENGRIEDAVALIRTAADNGQPAAQYRLAKLYETGEGVTLNAEMARKLTERAARSGNRIAMHDLALYHAEGRGGITMDLDTAAKWFEKAAQRGVVDSQFNLGVMYETGKGVPKNMTDAFVWYSIAAAQGDQFATQRVNFLQDKMDANNRAVADTRVAQFKPSKIDQAANGIFKSLPWATKNSSSPQIDGRVKEVQVMLMDLGFDTGGADGAIGPKTRTAIMNFEKANGLPETGRVNNDLVSKLEFASGA